MRIVLITQNDVFYLPRAISFLLANLPPHSQIVGAVVNDVSPFGKRETTVQKALKTWRIFGPRFFVHYAWRYLTAKLLGTDVVGTLAQHSIPLIDVKGNVNSEASLTAIRSYSPDLLISIAGNQIFRQPLIELARHGTLNLHTALLPKYRGLMPSFWVLKNGETHTGVSVFFVNKGIDTGPILVQRSIAIGNMSQEDLIRVTKELGMEAVIEAIKKIQHGDLTTLPNDDAQSSYYSFPTRRDVIEFRRAGKKLYQ